MIQAGASVYLACLLSGRSAFGQTVLAPVCLPAGSRAGVYYQFLVHLRMLSIS